MSNRDHNKAKASKKDRNSILNPATIDDRLVEGVPLERMMAVKAKGEGGVLIEPVHIRKFPICWGLPMDEMNFSLWFSNFIHLQIMPWDCTAVTLSTYLPDARNFIHDRFLEMKHINWLFMLDSDVMPPPFIVSQLLEHNKHLVGGWYKKKDGYATPVVYDAFRVDKDGNRQWHTVNKPGTGLARVEAAGAGCWLMHREVAEAIGKSPYSIHKDAYEDLELCYKVKKAGFEIWIDWDITCAHAGVGIT